MINKQMHKQIEQNKRQSKVTYQVAQITNRI